MRPSSILLTSAPHPWRLASHCLRISSTVITDFGIAPQHRPRTLGQTPVAAAYMSPEQARGDLGDARSDVYAMGVILHELISGRVPAATPIPQGQQDNTPQAIEGLPAAVQSVLDRALHKIRPIDMAASPNSHPPTIRAAYLPPSDGRKDRT